MRAHLEGLIAETQNDYLLALVWNLYYEFVNGRLDGVAGV